MVNRAQRYEILRTLDGRGPIRLHEVRIRSSNARAMYYDAPLPGYPIDTDAAIATLRIEAGVRNPRVPPVIDGWVDEDRIGWVSLEPAGLPLSDPESLRALSHRSKAVAEDLAWQTLAGLAALHDQSISHRQLEASCYTITPNGFVILRNTGLPRRIEKHFSGTGAHVMQLVSNASRLDVACWAALVLGTLSGNVVRLYGSDHSPESHPEDVTLLETQIASMFGTTPLAETLHTALQAFLEDEGGFDSANEALAALPHGVPA